LLVCVFHIWLRERPPIPYYVLKPAEEFQKHQPLMNDRSNEDVIRLFKIMPFDQLVTKLNNKQLMENGYTQRDLALGCLITFHHFNFAKAILGLPAPQQQRNLAFKESTNTLTHELIIYPGLGEQHYEAIIQYANTERWPLTSKGLFKILQTSEFHNEPSLAEAFFLTPEFSTVEMLFNRAEISIEKKDLLNILREGTWETLSAFKEQQQMSYDLSPQRRQRFLLDYVAEKSPSAAYLLLKTDSDFAIKKLDDKTITNILEVMKHKTSEVEAFALSMLKSPRSDSVWKQAASLLFALSGQPLPQGLTREMAITKFAPSTSPQKRNNPLAIIKAKPKQPLKLGITQEKLGITQEISKNVTPQKTIKDHILDPKKPSKAPPVQKPLAPSKKDRLYVVQEGDSLWKISKRFNVDVNILKKHNKLNSDFLKPGTDLRIP
jgi:hypothetical protein